MDEEEKEGGIGNTSPLSPGADELVESAGK